MGGAALCDAGAARRHLHRALQNRLVQVVSAELAGEPVTADPGRGKDPLPDPLPPGVLVLSRQRGGELDPTRAGCEVLRVLGADSLEVGHQVGLDDSGQHRDPILVAFAAAHDDLVGVEVYILDAQPTALEHALGRQPPSGAGTPTPCGYPADDDLHTAGAARSPESREPVRPERRWHAVRVSVPSGAGRKSFAENSNESELVAPTGFEPVFQP